MCLAPLNLGRRRWRLLARHCCKLQNDAALFLNWSALCSLAIIMQRVQEWGRDSKINYKLYYKLEYLNSLMVFTICISLWFVNKICVCMYVYNIYVYSYIYIWMMSVKRQSQISQFHKSCGVKCRWGDLANITRGMWRYFIGAKLLQPDLGTPWDSVKESEMHKSPLACLLWKKGALYRWI